MSTPKPFDTYFGGKAGSGTYQTIINQMPPHRVYVEPFVGGGAIFRMKRPAERSLLWDRDPAVVQPWIDAGVPMCQSVMELRPGAQIGIGNSRTLFCMFDHELDKPDTLIYVDPPYLTSTRKSGTRYNFEMDDDDHRILLAMLVQFSQAMIAISGYPSTLYDDLLADWRRIEYQAITRSGAMATEVLWMNYPEPTELHDYRYTGANYRERERIAKKVRRHVAKFKALPDLERKAILSALLTQHH